MEGLCRLKVLIIADPISKLNPNGDTSLRIAREFLDRKVSVFVTTYEEMVFETSQLFVRANSVQKFRQGSLPKLDTSKNFLITDFDLVLVRKDPPFDSSYVNLCWMLSAFEKSVMISNRPSVLLRHHEKMIPLEGLIQKILKPKDVLPTWVGQSAEMAASFVKSQAANQIVLKPYYGFGGREIELIDKKVFVKKTAEILKGRSDVMLQPFEPKIIKEGDRRVFFIGGKYAGSFVRLPKKGSIVSNLAQGGSAELRSLTKSEKKVIDRMEALVKEFKIDFAGGDLIASKVTEINITSPTGFVIFEKLSGKNIAKQLVDFYLKRLG